MTPEEREKLRSDVITAMTLLYQAIEDRRTYGDPDDWKRDTENDEPEETP
jgi:hypothetical protein